MTYYHGLMGQKIGNIRALVWKIIETDNAIRKCLDRDLMNVRSLAAYIIKTRNIDASLDSVISAIRRYERSPQKKGESSAYDVLKQAKISTRTGMSSLLLKRTDFIKSKLGRPDRLVDFQGHDTVRIFEGANALTLIIDRKNFEKIRGLFPRDLILEENKEVGMVEITYPRILKKTPGVFLVIANELADNDISIIDALISSNEHVLVVAEEKIVPTFQLLYGLCRA